MRKWRTVAYRMHITVRNADSSDLWCHRYIVVDQDEQKSDLKKAISQQQQGQGQSLFLVGLSVVVMLWMLSK